jgi:hypothetical protein
MLEFFYKADYSYEAENAGIHPLQFHAQMCSLADKYQIPALMHIAKEKYAHVLRDNPGLHDYLRSVPEVYVAQASGNELRITAVCFARRMLREGIKQDDVRTRLREVIDQVPEYGFDILEAFIKAPLMGECRTCGPDRGVDAQQTRCQNCGRTGAISIY